MLVHFGVKVREDNFLNRDNYAKINKKSSFKMMMPSVEYENVENRIYSDKWCEEYQQRCLKNFDINMVRFNQLDYTKFQNEISSFLFKHKKFAEIFDINDVLNVSGYYIMVLDKYKQLYIGTATDIGKRIKQHWSKRKQFDRLLFPMNNIEKSKFSIDSFGAFDTTRIFVSKSSTLYDLENEYIQSFSREFILNRVPGGRLSSLSVLPSPIYKKKTASNSNDICILIVILSAVVLLVLLEILWLHSIVNT